MKALMGPGMDGETLRLLDEIRTLRARVQELEQALEHAEATHGTTSTAADEATAARGELVDATA